jgi:hypothetical protein
MYIINNTIANIEIYIYIYIMYISSHPHQNPLPPRLVHLRRHRSCDGLRRVRGALQGTGEDRRGALHGDRQAVPTGCAEQRLGIPNRIQSGIIP